MVGEGESRKQLLDEIEGLRRRLLEYEHSDVDLNEAKEDLLRTKQRMDAILRTMVERVVLQEEEFTITWANRAAAESMGMTEECVIFHWRGLGVFQRISPVSAVTAMSSASPPVARMTFRPSIKIH